MVDPHEDPIELVESEDAAWRRQFEAERERLEALFDRRGLRSAVYRIEHVGSTAISELAAKDIVDIDVVVDDEAVSTVSAAIESELGGTRVRNHDGWHPVFRREDDQRFNDHVFGRSDPGWRISVATVGVLEERPALRRRYEQLKRQQAVETDDLETYSKAKSEFVGEVLGEARDFEFPFEVPRNETTE